MWRPVVTTVAPAAEPLSTADAKAHLRVDHTDDDTLIADNVTAARSHIEAVTGTRLVTQTVTVKTSVWAELASLPIAPVQSVVITYQDATDTTQTLAGSVYEARLDGLEASVVLKSGQAWPSTYPGSLVTVTAVVGYGVADAVPAPIVHAIKMIVGDMYAQRETAGDGSSAVAVAATVDALIMNYRKGLV